ncbi:hypothetical protein LCGC14_2097490 [marine sediment metagenome]|uniref:Uncharacterized protein n=1 Tax=marine sediment metagenome TaxID=412755 RepID=A0A0F9EB33_9ZZZZ
MPTIGDDGIVQTIDIGSAVPPIAGEQLGQLQSGPNRQEHLRRRGDEQP